MAGDRETGVSIHRTTAELDAGPIAAQRRFPIGPDDDSAVVFDRATRVALELLDEVFAEPTFVPQPEVGVTYADKITAADRELDWSLPPEENLNKIRALSPHIGARAGRGAPPDRVEGLAGTSRGDARRRRDRAARGAAGGRAHDRGGVPARPPQVIARLRLARALLTQ